MQIQVDLNMKIWTWRFLSSNKVQSCRFRSIWTMQNIKMNESIQNITLYLPIRIIRPKKIDYLYSVKPPASTKYRRVSFYFHKIARFHFFPYLRIRIYFCTKFWHFFMHHAIPEGCHSLSMCFSFPQYVTRAK